MTEISADVYRHARGIENAQSAPSSVQTASAADADAALIALEQQFKTISAELLALQQCSDSKRRRSPEGPPESGPDEICAQEPTTDEVLTGQMDAILTRLDPIERAIMATPAHTIIGLGVKARHVAHVTSQYWTAPIDKIDWDAQAIRLLIEAVCHVANVPVPFHDADDPNSG